MEDTQDKQQLFISWLASKLEAQDEEDLKSKLQKLGEEGIKQAYEQFLTEDSEAPKFQAGGKLDYIKCLQEFKQGGSIGCGCSGMKIKDKGGKLKMDTRGKNNVQPNDKKPQWLTNAQKKAEVKKHQLGGALTAKADNTRVHHTMEPKPTTTIPSQTLQTFARLYGDSLSKLVNFNSPDQVYREASAKYKEMFGQDMTEYDYNMMMKRDQGLTAKLPMSWNDQYLDPKFYKPRQESLQGNAQLHADDRFKKYQLGGQLSTIDTTEDPIKPGQPIKPTAPVSPAGYYMLDPATKAKVPVHAQAKLQTINGKTYDMTGLDGLDYDFQSKKYNVNPNWFQAKLKEKGFVGVGQTDSVAYGDWINQGTPAPREVFPQELAKPAIQGQGQHIVGTGGSQSGWQGSPQNTQIIEARERQLRAQSQMGRRPSMHQQGGQLQAKQPQAQPQGQAQGNVQPMTPEQVQNQKVDKKVMELTMNKQALADPSAKTGMQMLQDKLKPKQIKAKPEPKMRLRSNNDKLEGTGEIAKK